MKRLIIFISVLSTLSVLLLVKPTSIYAKIPGCLQISGTFTPTNWPGGNIQVACGGDQQGTAGCRGEVKSVAPGETFTLDTCSCPPYADGCLKIGQNLSLENVDDPTYGPVVVVKGDGEVPNTCTLNRPSTADSCGTNKDTRDHANFSISCSPPPAGTPPSSGPGCNTSCTKNEECAAATDSCTECINGTCQKPGSSPTATTAPTTEQPTATSAPTVTSVPPTPSVTPGGTCFVGKPCDVPACNADKGGTPNMCSECNGGVCFGGTCTNCGTNASPTPTTGPVCESPCETSKDCEASKTGCNTCIQKGGKKVCSTPGSGTPVPTPTEAFSPAMCHCDGLTTTALIPGQQVEVTAFGKIFGPDKTKATLKDAVFTLIDDKNKQIAISNPMPFSTPTETADMLRAGASWKFTLPGTLKQDVTYQISANINCARQTAMLYSPTTLVMATAVDNRTLLQKILSFFGQVTFGHALTSGPVVPTPTPDQKALQIKNFSQATIITKQCTYVRFKLPAQ